MAGLASSPETMAQNFLAGLSFLSTMNLKNTQAPNKKDNSGNTGNSGTSGIGGEENRKNKKKNESGGRNVGWKSSEAAAERTHPQWCDVCRITLNAPDQLEQHYAGKAHSKRLKMTHREAEELVKTAAESQTSGDEPSSLPPSRLVKRVIDANAPRGENGQLRCVLCEVTMPSPQVAQTHFNGKKHQKKLAALKSAEQTRQELLTETVCDLTLAGTIGADVSLTRALKRQHPPNALTDTGPSTSITSAPSYRPTEAAFHCDVCDITVTSMTQLTQHQSGLKHLKRVQKESREKT